MPTSTIIHTIRHAHTTYNEQGRYAGSIDVPLSSAGTASAQARARDVAGIPLDLVITSTLQRAITTAQLLTGDRVTTTSDPLCNERRFGILEGLTIAEVRDVDPPILLIEVGDDFHTVNPKGGEPFEDVWRRAQLFRDKLFQRHEGKRILVVSHGVFLQMFHGVLRGLNCIESLTTYPKNLELRAFHCTEHGSVLHEEILSTKTA